MSQEKIDLLVELSNHIAKTPYEEMTLKDKLTFQFALDAMFWVKRVDAGEVIAPDPRCPKPTREQVSAFYDYLTH